MTNNINGIDVSECKYLNKVVDEEPYCNIDEEHLYTCSSDENCYFKQFKRLQEENKELKEKQIINDIDKLDGMVKIKGKCGYEFIGGCRELKKYKQALEEIRGQYVNKAFFKCDKTEEECPCHNCIILGQLDRVQNIIKIIDEVLNDRD